jgi:hypothetical protein
MDPLANRLKRYIRKKQASMAMRLRFLHQFLHIRRHSPARFRAAWTDLQPCYNDAAGYATFDRHYIFHTAWAARVLAETTPSEHIDISSSLYFVANVSAFIPIRFYDYRPAQLELSNLTSHHGDLVHLPFDSGSVHSLSCMHVLEHVGLGRYGDPLDYDGDLKAATELQRVMRPGGQLLIALPIGRRARIQFNAHRIYTFALVMEMFRGMHLREFALIQDDHRGGGLIRRASPALADEQSYGCGCFHFVRSGA